MLLLFCMRNFFLAILVFILLATSVRAVDNTQISTARTQLEASLQSLLALYSERVRELEEQNAKLIAENTDLKARLSAGNPLSSITASGTTAKVIANILENSPNLLDENSITDTMRLAMFEFVEGAPRYTTPGAIGAVFVNLEDPQGRTPGTAFRYKMLYEYNAQLALTSVGMFEIDASTRYVTRKGSNPYAQTKRLKIANPRYQGSILDIAANNIDLLTGNITPIVKPAAALVNPGASSTPTTSVTRQSVIDYNAKNLNDGPGILRLANAYLASNSTDTEILRIRASAFYILQRYTDAVRDVDTIERLGGLDRSLACLAQNFATKAKLTDREKHYASVCKL